LEAKQSRVLEQAREIGEKLPQDRGAVHWAGGMAHIAGAAHWAAISSVKLNGRGTYTGRSTLGLRHGA